MLAFEPPPSITDWMQGWGSLLGVAVSSLGCLVSVAAVGITGWLLRNEMNATTAAEKRAEEERALRFAERRDTEAAQARLIVPYFYPGYQEYGDEYAGWAVTNYSSAPVFGLRSALIEAEGDRVERDACRMVAPGKSEHGEWRSGPTDYMNPQIDGDEVPGWSILIEFTDAHGLRWRREGDQLPQRVYGAPEWPFDDPSGGVSRYPRPREE